MSRPARLFLSGREFVIKRSLILGLPLVLAGSACASAQDMIGSNTGMLNGTGMTVVASDGSLLATQMGQEVQGTHLAEVWVERSSLATRGQLPVRLLEPLCKTLILAPPARRPARATPNTAREGTRRRRAPPAAGGCREHHGGPPPREPAPRL